MMKQMKNKYFTYLFTMFHINDKHDDLPVVLRMVLFPVSETVECPEGKLDHLHKMK